jgi:hypothetical protein
MTPHEMHAMILAASHHRLYGAVSMETREAIFLAGMRAAAGIAKTCQAGVGAEARICSTAKELEKQCR